MLNALAGVQEECLYQDYLMSNYGNIGSGRDRGAIDYYITTLRGTYQGGSDLSLGARNYLSSIGVSDNTIDTIKGILLGEINPLA